MKGDRDRTGFPCKKVSIKERKSKVSIEDFARMPADLSWYAGLRQMIPRILTGKDLEELSEKVVTARAKDRPVIFMLGAHVVKCGLGGLLCGLIRKEIVTGIAMNGACAIHDLEIAMWGKTSEDVGEGLKTGEFGMAEETAGLFNAAAQCSLEESIGLGNALGKSLSKAGAPNQSVSLLATTHGLDVPATVHVALGTDVVHQHADADGKAIGNGTMEDFRRFTSMITNLNGGVVLNIGSAVIMPEVFLKAVAVARNAGADLGAFTTANFDMYSLYRPTVNIIERPRLLGASTFSFLGSHEILLPVFVASILWKLQG
jgi:deoxyhypusine synthase